MLWISIVWAILKNGEYLRNIILPNIYSSCAYVNSNRAHGSASQANLEVAK